MVVWSDKNVVQGVQCNSGRLISQQHVTCLLISVSRKPGQDRHTSHLPEVHANTCSVSHRLTVSLWQGTWGIQITTDVPHFCLHISFPHIHAYMSHLLLCPSSFCLSPCDSPVFALFTFFISSMFII